MRVVSNERNERLLRGQHTATNAVAEFPYIEQSRPKGENVSNLRNNSRGICEAQQFRRNGEVVFVEPENSCFFRRFLIQRTGPESSVRSRESFEVVDGQRLKKG